LDPDGVEVDGASEHCSVCGVGVWTLRCGC
jgi:hypothetical protein